MSESSDTKTDVDWEPVVWALTMAFFVMLALGIWYFQ